jgi:hypothetical protein
MAMSPLPLQLPLDASKPRRIRMVGQDLHGRPTVVIHLNDEAEERSMRAFLTQLAAENRVVA